MFGFGEKGGRDRDQTTRVVNTAGDHDLNPFQHPSPPTTKVSIQQFCFLIFPAVMM